MFWMLATFMSKPTDKTVLINFVKKINPGGPGWKRFDSGKVTNDWNVPKGILMMFLGCLSVYSFLFAIGYLIYGNTDLSLIILTIGFAASFGLYKIWTN